MDLKIGLILRKVMKERGVTLKELSLASGVSISTLSEWGQNRVPKNPIQIKAVANALGVSMHFLLFGEVDQHEKVSVSKILQQEVVSGAFEITIKRLKID